MLKGPLASLERHDRPAFEGRSGSERSTEPGSSAKTVASQPVVGYRIRSRTAKKEILDGYTLFSGDPYSQWYGIIAPELNDHLDGPFGGRDVVSVGDAFGETFLYYSARNPATGMLQNKVTFVKRVVAYGLPILVGAGYYLDE